MAYLRGKYGPYSGFDVGDLARKRYVETLTRRAGLWPGDRALDVACGHGTVSNALARTFHKCRVSGLDADPANIARARENAVVEDCQGRLDFVVGDPTDLPYKDETFLVTTCVLALADHPDHLAVLEELHRVTAFMGKVLVVDMDFTKAASKPRAMKKHVLGADTQGAMREMGYGKMQLQRVDTFRGGGALMLLAAKRFDPESAEGEGDEDEVEDDE